MTVLRIIKRMYPFQLSIDRITNRELNRLMSELGVIDYDHSHDLFQTHIYFLRQDDHVMTMLHFA